MAILTPASTAWGRTVLEESDHGVNVLLDRPGRQGGAIGGKQTAHERRPHRFRPHDLPSKGAGRSFEGFRGFRQDCASAGFQMELEIGRLGANFGPVGGLLGSGVERILEENGVELKAGGVVEEFAIVPTEGS